MTRGMDAEPSRVLQLVRKPGYARHLLRHERNQRVRNTGGAYYWLDEKGKFKVLRGIRPRLNEALWPHCDGRAFPRPVAGQAKRSPAQVASTGRFGGLIKGSHVHGQMHDFVQLDERAFRKRYPQGLDPYAQRLLRVIVKQLRLQPFLAEFDVWCERLRIGTSIDMIGLDEQGRLGLLEFKTGYKDYFDAQDGMIGGSLQLRNTPQNQATLQLLGAAAILKERYDVPYSAMRLTVLRVDDCELEVLPVSPAFVERAGPLLYQDLLAYETKRVAAKAAAKAAKKRGIRKKVARR